MGNCCAQEDSAPPHDTAAPPAGGDAGADAAPPPPSPPPAEAPPLDGGEAAAVAPPSSGGAPEEQVEAEPTEPAATEPPPSKAQEAASQGSDSDGADTEASRPAWRTRSESAQGTVDSPPLRTPPAPPMSKGRVGVSQSHSPLPNPLENRAHSRQAPGGGGGVLSDGNHSGIRWQTPVYLCGGKGPRAFTVTDWSGVRSASAPGYRVADSSLHWHSLDDKFSLHGTYEVMQDNGVERHLAYCPRADDRFLMVMKPKVIEVQHGGRSAQLMVSVGHDHTLIVNEATERLSLPCDHYGLRSCDTHELFSTAQYRDLVNGGAYALEGLQRCVYVYGDRRVVDWPRPAPLSTRTVPIVIPASADVAYVIQQAAHALLPSSFPQALRDGLELAQFPNGFPVPSPIPRDTLLELRVPPKVIHLNHGDRTKKLSIQPGWTTMQTMARIKADLRIAGSYQLHGAVPTWSFLRHGKEYSVDRAESLLAVQFDVDEPRSEGDMVATREEVTARRREAFSLEDMAVSCQRVFGVEGGKFLLGRDVWAAGERVEVLYNDGEDDDGFYKAQIITKYDKTYTVKFTDTGEYSAGVRSDSIFIPLRSPTHFQVAPRTRLIFLPPKKAVTLRCGGKSDVSHEIASDDTFEDLVAASKRCFSISFETVFDVRCELTGTLLATSNSFFGTSALWNAVVPHGIYTLALREKRIHLLFQGETERSGQLLVQQHHREADILDMIKRAGRCGMGSGWEVFAESDPQAPVVPTYTSLREGALYIVRERSKTISVKVDPRVLDQMSVMRQDIVVAPHIKAQELWRVIVVHPALCLSDIWKRLHLPEQRWTSPSPNPTAVCVCAVMPFSCTSCSVFPGGHNRACCRLHRRALHAGNRRTLLRRDTRQIGLLHQVSRQAVQGGGWGERNPAAVCSRAAA